MTGTAALLAPTLCTRIDIKSRQERDRLFALSPNANAALALWTIYATPSAEFGLVAGLPLASALASIDDADVSDLISYGNPFPGGARILELVIVATRPEGDFTAV